VVSVCLENHKEQLGCLGFCAEWAALPSAVHWYSSMQQVQHLAVDFHFGFSHTVAPLHLRLRLFSVLGWDFCRQMVLFDITAQPI